MIIGYDPEGESYTFTSIADTIIQEPMVTSDWEPPLDANIEQSGEYWSRRVEGSPDDALYWLAVPEVRWWNNRRLTGNPDRQFLTDFLARTGQRHGPMERILGVGCGSGELERGVLLEGAACNAEGVDVASGALESAREAAAAHDLNGRLEYFLEDAESFLRRRVESGASYDAIFFHGSLHHIERLEAVVRQALRLVASGRPGVLYVDEYVGPSRGEWTDGDLAFATGLFARLPECWRRTPEMWPPIAMDDPTEMIRSSEIPTVLAQEGEIVERRSYFGNVVAPLVNAIRPEAIHRPEVWPIVETAMELEDLLARRGALRPLYEVFVVAPRETNSA